MEQFQHIGVFQHFAQVGGRCLALGNLNNMRVAVAIGQLNHTQPIPIGAQAHCFTIDCHNRSQNQIVWQVALVQIIRHGFALCLLFGCEIAIKGV